MYIAIIEAGGVVGATPQRVEVVYLCWNTPEAIASCLFFKLLKSKIQSTLNFTYRDGAGCVCSGCIVSANSQKTWVVIFFEVQIYDMHKLHKLYIAIGCLVLNFQN